MDTQRIVKRVARAAMNASPMGGVTRLGHVAGKAIKEGAFKKRAPDKEELREALRMRKGVKGILSEHDKQRLNKIK